MVSFLHSLCQPQGWRWFFILFWEVIKCYPCQTLHSGKPIMHNTLSGI